jgi:hypothetical protein
LSNRNEGLPLIALATNNELGTKSKLALGCCFGTGVDSSFLLPIPFHNRFLATVCNDRIRRHLVW